MFANTGSDAPVQNSSSIAPHKNACDARRARTFVKHLRLVAGAAFLAISASLVAETHFCIGGDLDHLAPTGLAACEAKMGTVRDAVKQRGAPADWHFVVVCDEVGWKEYTSFSGHEPGLLSGANYSTDPRLHWTFLRGSDLTMEHTDATASLISMALDSVPAQRNAPQPPSSTRATRQYGIAMARHTKARTVAQ